MKNKIKELLEKENSNFHGLEVNWRLNTKEEMNKLIELDHECSKISLNLIIFGFKEEKEEDTLVLVKEKLHENLQIQTTCLTET